MKTSLAAFLLIFCGLSFADLTRVKANEGPCHQIAETCEKAGFIKGDWKKGDGLWADCACPAITGKANPKATKSAPTIDPALISGCKAKRPSICAKYHPK